MASPELPSDLGDTLKQLGEQLIQLGDRLSGPKLTSASPVDSDADFKLLLQLCDIDHNMRMRSRAIRPEVTEPGTTNPIWERAVRMIYNSLCRNGKIHLRHALDRPSPPSWDPQRETPEFCEEEIRGLRAVAAILYEQECSGGFVVPYMEPHPGLFIPNIELKWEFSALFQHMARIDYGISNEPPRTSGSQVWGTAATYSAMLMRIAHKVRLGQPFSQKALYAIGSHLNWLPGSDPADIAIMLYHFESHRSAERSKESEAGYTGVLTELINEIPEKGTERLLRKLSTDVQLVHRWGSYQPESDAMGLEAERIADEHGLTLWNPDVAAPFRVVESPPYHWFARAKYDWSYGEPYLERALMKGRIEAAVAQSQWSETRAPKQKRKADKSEGDRSEKEWLMVESAQ